MKPHPHLRAITVCPVCGHYKPRQQVTCGHHDLNPRCLAIVNDYEAALADKAKRETQRPMLAKQAQKPCDLGLFSDDSLQIDLIDMLR